MILQSLCLFSDIRTPVMRDTSAISSRLGRAIRTLLEVRLETKCHFLVAKVI